MIYLDSSVALAEDRVPPESLWQAQLCSSRLLEYEIWNRIHAHKLASSHGPAVRALVGEVALLDLTPSILERALQPFPRSVRTLEGLHLATMELLRTQGETVELASYDVRLNAGARVLNFALFSL